MTELTNPVRNETPDRLIIEEKPEVEPVKIIKRRQFKPGQRLVDSYKRQYYVDQNSSLRRVEGGKLTKAAKKAAKRQRLAGRRAG